MRFSIILYILVSLSSINVFGHENYQCYDLYQKRINRKVNLLSDEERKGIYKADGYYWLQKVAGKEAALFIVAFVPGAIPLVLSATAVSWLYEKVSNEKGIVGAHSIINLSLRYESNDNKDSSKLGEENFFDIFVKRVNRKYKNSKYTPSQVREAIVTLATEDDRLCMKKNKVRLTRINKLAKLVKKELRKSHK
ncbi:MAG: hypothetical protein BM556_15405 [Bacteriovorax sp. MedPE-SWde]|nr:MAG: hypothetical protein BM556_15405 [Bacteriovorax sp. MedPE-SWde]